MKRRICWPDPDATCLEGGCIWCQEARFHSFAAIERYVKTIVGALRNRGVGEQPAEEAWARGLRNSFYGRVEVR